MRILTVVAMILGVAALAQAEPVAKGQSLQAYSKTVKKIVEKQGKTFDAAKVEANFAKFDTNKDGILTKAERIASRKPKKK